MNYFIFTAIVALAASKSKAQTKATQTNKTPKDNSDSAKTAVRKAR